MSVIIPALTVADRLHNIAALRPSPLLLATLNANEHAGEAHLSKYDMDGLHAAALEMNRYR